MGTAAPLVKEDWAREVTRPAASPPPIPATLEEYLALDRRTRFYLEERRVAYHGELVVVPTPQMREAHTVMRTTIRANRTAPTGARRGWVVDGGPNLGKSTLALELGRQYERELREFYPERFDPPSGEYLPVVFLSMPSSPSIKMIAKRVAGYLNIPLPRSANTHDITQAILATLAACGTELVIFDEVHFLDLASRNGQDANDFLKDLANHCRATFVLCGVELERSRLFTEGGKRAAQNATRFAPLPLEPFGQGLLAGTGSVSQARAERDSWCRVVHELERSLRLYRHESGSLVRDEWRYLLERSGGKIGTLSSLIRVGSCWAIESGHERLDRVALEAVRVDFEASKNAQRSSAAS